MKHWILDADLREVEVDLMTWAQWFQTEHRHVGEDFIDDYRISTIFLGIDHNWSMNGPPLIYETMLFKTDPTARFGERSLQLIDRYSTWIEAEEGHEKALQEFKEWLRQRGELAGNESPVRHVPIPARLPGPSDGESDPGQGADQGEPDLPSSAS